MNIMRTRGGINHLDLNVIDLERSAAFYDRILGYMGYQRSHIATPENPGHDWYAPRDGVNRLSLGIVRAKNNTPHDRTAAGLQHLAFHAESREDVDGLYKRTFRSPSN
jgi:glyoxylase I family protein